MGFGDRHPAGATNEVDHKESHQLLGAGHRIPRPRPHFGGRRAGVSRARRSGRGTGSMSRTCASTSTGRPERAARASTPPHSAGPNHAPAHRNCRHLSKRAIAAAKNKARAMLVLAARLQALAEEQASADASADRPAGRLRSLGRGHGAVRLPPQRGPVPDVGSALRARRRGRHRALSAGTTPGRPRPPRGRRRLWLELGIDVGGRVPRRLNLRDLAEEADVVVTMGCGDECPYIPGSATSIGTSSDPKGLPLDEVRVDARRHRASAWPTSSPSWTATRSARRRSPGSRPP